MKIICVGRNYSKHATELGNEIPSEPVIFMKPDSALMRQRDKFYIPDFSNDVHFEAELVFRINRIGKRIQPKFAHKYFTEFTLGIDFTARDVQAELKSKGLPWEKAKAFDQSAVVGKWLNLESHDLDRTEFELRRNGERVQLGKTQDMLYKIDALVEHISQFFTLKIGDLIFTGTPEGVGKVESYDLLEGFVNGEKVLNLNIR